MVSQLTKSIIFNVISSLFVWGGFSIGAAALANLRWQVRSTTYFGLFQTCNSATNVCTNIIETSWLLAVRAFLIMMVITVMAGIVVNTVSYCVNRLRVGLGKVSVVIFLVAGVFGIIAMAVYNGNTDPALLGFHYGAGNLLGWISVCLPFPGAIFAYISVRIIENCR